MCVCPKSLYLEYLNSLALAYDIKILPNVTILKRLGIMHSRQLHILENIQSSKHLGITITEDSDQGHHISYVLSKATETFVTRRNSAFAP